MHAPFCLRRLCGLFRERRQDAFPKPGRIPVPECLDFPWTDVPQVRADAHQLVIAEQRHHSSAGPLRILLELTQQVDGFSRVRSAIEHVARLHQYRPAANPLVAIVDDLRRAQDGDEVVERTVDVANGHHRVGGLNLTGRRTSRYRLRVKTATGDG
jgi:hypothetical protein